MNVNYDDFSEGDIKNQLKQRGMSTKGSRAKLVARLKHCVKQAWDQWNKKQKQNNGDQNARKPPKKKLSEAEKDAIRKQNEENRLAKLKRKAENAQRAEEARERKRQRREEQSEKAEERAAQQKEEKEARQKLEAHATLDMKLFSAQLRKKLDPKNNRISSMNYDFSKKGFVIKFTQPKFVETCTKGSTINNLTNYKLSLSTSILPAPIESNCVYFLSPTANNHPNKAAAEKWLLSKRASDKPELEKLQLWVASACAAFGKKGTIVNVFRERGFLVVQYKDSSAADSFMSSMANKKFNGVPFVFLRAGTPTKKDRNDCDAENPMPKKEKKAKKE